MNKQIRLYIRFGNLPVNGKSRNALNGIIEKGVSVFPANLNFNTGAIEFKSRYVITKDIHEKYGDRYVNIIYLVTGKFMGYGSDNEPVIKNVVILARLEFDLNLLSYTIVLPLPT